MHEKRGRSNTTTTSTTTALTGPSSSGLASGDCGEASRLPPGGSGHTTPTTTTTSPSTSPPPPESLEALLRLKRANMCTLRTEPKTAPSCSETLPTIVLSSPAGAVPLTHFSADHFATRSRLHFATRSNPLPVAVAAPKQLSCATSKTKRGVTKKATAVAEWKPKEVAKWLQAIELGDYAKAARKRKVDGAQLVKVVDAFLPVAHSPSSSSSIATPAAADGGVVLAALGIKKLGHLKRLKRELRQELLAASNEDTREGEDNAPADGRGDALQGETQDREEELERSLKLKHKVSKLPIPRINSAPAAAPCPNPPLSAQSPNRLRRMVQNIAGGGSSLSSSPSSVQSSHSPSPPPPPSPSASSASSASFPIIEADSDSFLPVPLESPSSARSSSQTESLSSPDRPRTRSRFIERLAPGMSRSRSSDAPTPRPTTPTSGSQSCSMPSFVSPPPSPKPRFNHSAGHAAVAHGVVSFVDEDDDCSSSTISSASSSSSNDGAAPMTFSFSFPSSAPMPTSSSSAASSSSHSASSISVTSDALSAPYASCTSLAFCSMFGEVAIKCVVDDDISLVRLNLDTDLSYSGLQRAIELVYGQRMRAHYFDLEGDKIRIANDSSLRYAYEDWRQALERSGPAISWRLHLKPARRSRTHSESSPTAPSPADVADDPIM